MLSKIKRVYHSKWFPRIFFKKYDGGKESGVTGYMLIEWKPVLSIGFLHFKEGSREAYHTHAFNALTWWLKGKVTELRLDSEKLDFTPSFKPKLTKRDNCHKVIAHKPTWAFTLRGPWEDKWTEVTERAGIHTWTVLTHGRQIVERFAGVLPKTEKLRKQ